jgi:glycosidase
VASRLGPENVNLANVLNLLLGGTAMVYYGEEIGMEVVKFHSIDYFGYKHVNESDLKNRIYPKKP